MKKRTFLKLSSIMVAGASVSPLIDWAQDGKLTNWAGNLTYSVSPVVDAASTDDIRALLNKYEKLKVLGTRHCFNDIADSKHHLINLHKLDKIGPLDRQRHEVTVGAGVRYGELAVWLNDHGYALHNLASLPHINVVGGCTTATHGSGAGNGNLSSAVRAIEFITAGGERVHLSRDKDGDLFHGVVVNLGALGVVTSITLAVEPTYQVRQYVYQDMPMSALALDFDAIMSAGYSVSLFTDWRNENINEVWIKSKTGDGRVHGVEFHGAKAATRNLHPIAELSAENCTPQMGVAGPWHERLPHFKMGFTPSSGKELQSEYFVPREHSYAAIRAVASLHEKISPHLFITEIRCIDADDLWMSTAYKRPSTAIHFTWKQEWAAVKALLPLIEAKLAPYHPRPHWGKLFTLPPTPIRDSYERIRDFRALAARYDPRGKFRNDYLDHVIFGA